MTETKIIPCEGCEHGRHYGLICACGCRYGCALVRREPLKCCCGSFTAPTYVHGIQHTEHRCARVVTR